MSDVSAEEPVSPADTEDLALPLPDSTLYPRLSALLLASLLSALVFATGPGSAIALAYALPLAALALLRGKGGWSKSLAAIFSLAALAAVAILIEPGPINMLVGIAFLIATALVVRGVALEDGLGLVRHGLRSLIRSPAYPFFDSWRFRSHRTTSNGIPRLSAVLVPILTIVVFGKLLASANPLLADKFFFFSSGLNGVLTFSSILAFIVTLMLAWSVLRKAEPIAARLPSGVIWTSHGAYFGPVGHGTWRSRKRQSCAPPDPSP